jgi:DNA-binding MarR family transcriptional regulator
MPDPSLALISAAPLERPRVGGSATDLRCGSSQRAVNTGNLGATREAPLQVDLSEIFGLLACVKRSLCAEIDVRLRADHQLPLQAFDALTVISNCEDGCDEATIAAALSVSPPEAGTLVEALVSAGHVRRVRRRDGAVDLTLRGSVLLSKAGRTLDRELERGVRSVLLPGELAQLEDALSVLRRSTEATESLLTGSGF